MGQLLFSKVGSCRAGGVGLLGYANGYAVRRCKKKVNRTEVGGTSPVILVKANFVKL